MPAYLPQSRLTATKLKKLDLFRLQTSTSVKFVPDQAFWEKAVLKPAIQPSVLVSCLGGGGCLSLLPPVSAPADVTRYTLVGYVPIIVSHFYGAGLLKVQVMQTID